MNQETVQRALDSAIPLITTYGMRVIGAVLILIIGRILAGVIGKLVGKALERGKVELSLRHFLVNLTRIAVLVFAVIAALAKFGIETTSFVAILGAAGFAIGFALQGSLSNFAAGVMIIIFKPIKVGDLVKTCGYLGEVEEIGLFVTVMNTLDNQRIIIPNGKLTSDVINNVNGNGLRRVDLTAGISYGDDMNLAKKLCMEILENHPHVLQDPAPQVAVAEMADSSVNLVVRPWCHPDHYWDIHFDVTQSIKEAFDANGITIPFPQREVWNRMIEEAS
ncbi:mechanosensitive ion channel protein [bacterium DOLJORAL78_65_58]|nr:MAG: mechanosensitive ion channel protein [bacterium DOLZORAL124_64_63]PIE76809.1 MAG: mechanosensitive ion channel protein [bacterium DOLJORAL78_65_58]